MGLVILIIVGAILGWLATILLRIEDSRGVLLNMAAGTVGSVGAGLIAGPGTVFGGVSAVALLWALLGGALLIAALYLVRLRAYN